MADETSDDNEITREELASNLREIAVGEGSSMIGSDSERISIEAEWTPEN
jgi:hypothetical protein